MVRFLHIAAVPGPSPSLAKLQADLAGSISCVLPDQRLGIIDHFSHADPAKLQQLRAVWQDYGITLPAEVCWAGARILQSSSLASHALLGPML